MVTLISKVVIWLFYKILVNPVKNTISSVSNIFTDPKISLKDCINHFCKIDCLEKDNMYSCEKCKKLRNGERYYSLGKMPKVLIFHMKRFRHFGGDVMGYGHDSGVKITKFVDFEEFYNFNGETFKLYSVLMHHGSSLNFGHYTSYVRSEIDDNFYHCDDKFVEKVPKADVFTAQAYVLFYRKIDKSGESTSEIAFNTNPSKSVAASASASTSTSTSKFPSHSLENFDQQADNLAWFSRTLQDLKPSSTSCFISQLSLFQLIFNLKSLNSIVLNEDLICQHGKVSLHVKSQAMYKITTELWQEIIEYLDNKGNHFFVESDDYCEVCKRLAEEAK